MHNPSDCLRWLRAWTLMSPPPRRTPPSPPLAATIPHHGARPRELASGVAGASDRSPIVSITARVTELEDYELFWLEFHRHHHDPDEGDDLGPSEVRFGALDDDSDEEGEDQLLKCRGSERPRKKAISIEVRPAEGNLVTVHDYVSAVHPRLMAAREDIVGAIGVSHGKQLAADTKLVVSCTPDTLQALEKDEYLRSRTNSVMPAITTKPRTSSKWATKEWHVGMDEDGNEKIVFSLEEAEQTWKPEKIKWNYEAWGNLNHPSGSEQLCRLHCDSSLVSFHDLWQYERPSAPYGLESTGMGGQTRIA